MEKEVNYEALTKQARALVEGVPYVVANLANLSALLWQSLPQINWVGFYKMEPEGLVLWPFQGKPACIRIPQGRGVCGRAAQEGKTILVADVHSFPGHIACDSASQSEIVVPLWKNGTLWGVLDIDSPIQNRFTLQDQAGLEQLAAVVESVL